MPFSLFVEHKARLQGTSGSFIRLCKVRIMSAVAAAAVAVPRAVTRVVTAIEQAEGVGARVRRAIGNRHLEDLDPFLMV
jgi:hypothetical protein